MDLFIGRFVVNLDRVQTRKRIKVAEADQCVFQPIVVGCGVAFFVVSCFFLCLFWTGLFPGILIVFLGNFSNA